MNKVEKIKKLADAMYNRMQNLTTDTSGIRKAMDEYHQFIINEYYKEDTEKDFSIKESVIPFGASDSELMEATYFIPQGYHAVIDGNKVIIKKGEEPVSNDLEEAAWTYYDKNKPLIPHELDLHKEMISFFIAGAQWEKERDQSTIELAEDHAYLAGQEKIIKKACEWLNIFYSEDRHCYFVEEDIDNFKKAMEE